MKKWFLPIFIILLAGLSYGYYEYSRGPRNLESETTDLAIGAESLVQQFEADENLANTTYLDKVIEVKGTILEIHPPNDIVLDANNMMSNVVCEFQEEMTTEKLNIGDPIIIKGQCTGYLSDVILVKSVIINK